MKQSLIEVKDTYGKAIDLKNNTLYFLHIPKTAGTYMMQDLTTGEPLITGMRRVGKQHGYFVSEDLHCNAPVGNSHGLFKSIVFKSNYSDHTIITSIRNPFELLVSVWAYVLHEKQNHFDRKACEKGFEYFLKTVIDRDNVWPSRKFLFCQCWCSDGDLMVDYFFRRERIEEDVMRFCRENDITFSPGTPQRVGSHDGYMRYYNDNLLHQVEETWKRELDLFGYTSNGFYPPENGIEYSILQDKKSKVKYKWETDELIIGGEQA